MEIAELRDRFMAMSLGVGIGDALGMPLEIMTPEKIAELYGRVMRYLAAPKNHKWHKEDMFASKWTDDKQLEMAMERSLIRCKGINLDDIAREHVLALIESFCGWGGNTTQAVRNIQSGIHWSKSGIPDAAGNGVAMKIAPFGALLAIEYMRLHAMYPLEEAEMRFNDYRSDFHSCIVEIARMTHQSRMAIASGLAQAYAVFASMVLPEEDFAENFLQMVIDACLLGESMRYRDNVQDKLSDRLIHLRDTRNYERMSVEELEKEYGGKGKARFYVLNSLVLSYALFLHNPCSIEAMFDAVNAGGDTDTNASIVGALIGAKNGMKIFSGYEYLVDGLWRKEEVMTTAEQFCETFI